MKIESKDLIRGGKYYDKVIEITNRWTTLKGQIEYTLANCTVAVCVVCLIKGLPMPVSKITSANKFHTVATNGWQVIPYTDGMTLKDNDILEWSCNHVAIMNGNKVYASWWTNYDGTPKGDRNMEFTKSVDETLLYFYKNYERRFFHETTLDDECKRAGKGVMPQYILRYESDVKDYKSLYENVIKELRVIKAKIDGILEV